MTAGRASTADSVGETITRAAFRARTVYPGPVGTLICRELLAWADFGHRLGPDGLVSQLVRDILDAPPGDRPEPDAEPARAA